MENQAGPIVSIIIPIYNSEKTIQRCLESVYQSKYQLFEVIAVDDGSTDASLQIIRKYPAKIIKLDKRRGCAFARNRGAQEAKGRILFFVDSDILLEPHTINKVVETFTQKPKIWATFGSYSKKPIDSKFFSVYKNLLHYYTHQTSSEDASTFWTGCGAVKKDAFEKLGGFDEDPDYYPIEDIAFGYKISKHGGKIYLNKQLQIRHLKGYTFLSLIKSDFIHRAIPWTEIILKERFFRGDLNLKIGNIISGILVLVILFGLFILLSINGSTNLLFIPSLLVISLFILNLGFYWFIFREKGLLFTLAAVLMNFLFYLYSGIGFLVGIVRYLWNDLIIKKD